MRSFIRSHPLGVGASGVAVLAGLAWLAFGFFGVHTLFIDDVVDEAGPVFDATPAVVADAAGAAPSAEPIDESAPARPVVRADDGDADTGTDNDNGTDTDDDTDATDGAAVDGGDTGDAADVDPVPVVSADATPDATPADEPPATTTPEPEIVTELLGSFESDAHPTSGTAIVLGNGTGQRFLRFEGFETDNGPDLNVYLFNVNGDRSDYVDLGDLKGNIGDQNYEIPVDVDLSVYGEVSIWCVRFGVGFGSADLMAT